MLVKRSSQLSYCVLTGGKQPPCTPEHTGQCPSTEAGRTAAFCRIHRPNVGRFLLHQKINQCVYPLTFKGIGMTKSNCTLSLMTCQGNKAIKASDHEVGWCTSSSDTRPENQGRPRGSSRGISMSEQYVLLGKFSAMKNLRNALGVCREDALEEERYRSGPGNEPVCC